jgi:hypothetical protein
MSMAISWTRRLWPLVNLSRLSTASARLLTVSVNISRTSTKRRYASLLVYTGTANSSTAHHPAVAYI